VTKSSFSRIKLQRRKENVVYVNSGRVIAAVNILKSNLIMEETLPDKRILGKSTRKGMSLAFYITATSQNPKQAITLKHLIASNNLKMYINPKSIHQPEKA